MNLQSKEHVTKSSLQEKNEIKEDSLPPKNEKLGKGIQNKCSEWNVSKVENFFTLKICHILYWASDKESQSFSQIAKTYIVPKDHKKGQYVAP